MSLGGKCRTGKCRTGKWRTWTIKEHLRMIGQWPCNNAHAVKGRVFKKCLWCLSDGTPMDSDEEAVAQEETPAMTQNNAADMCEVCLLAPRSGVALVPCGHSRFCASCADTVTALGNGCPLCRAPINMVLRLFA